MSQWKRKTARSILEKRIFEMKLIISIMNS